MAAHTKPIELNCPCCGALLVVDPDTRALLRHEPPPKPAGASFEEMVKEVDLSKKRTESKLMRAMEEQGKRDEILEKKFREAIKKAESSPTPPHKPFDND